MDRQILTVGIGGGGCAVAENIYRKSNNISGLRYLALDTDEGALSALSLPGVFSLAYVKGEEEGPPEEEGFYLREITRGSGLWRAGASYAFERFLGDADRRKRLERALSQITGEVELYVAASLAGGTGSGLLLPLTRYICGLIEGAGGVVTECRAFLAMPEILSDSLSAEQRLKAGANAYAALRELNAQYERAASDSEDSTEGRLFDRVYLFERTPGVQTATENLNLIADVMASLMTADSEIEPNTELNRPWGSVSYKNVAYPIEGITEYITKQSLLAFADRELGCLHSAAEAAAAEAARCYRDTYRCTPDDTGYYAEAYAEAFVRASEQPLPGLVASDIPLPFGVDEKLTRISAASAEETLRRPFCGDIMAGLRGLIAAERELASGGRGGLTPRERRDRFTETAERFNSCLDRLYRSCLEEYYLRRAEFEQSCFEGDAEGDFSLRRSVLMYEGEYLHPVYALGRLCLFRVSLSGRGCSEAQPKYAPNVQLPDSYLYFKDCQPGKSRYSARKDSRFFYVLRGYESLKAAGEAELAQLPQKKRASAERRLKARLSACRAEILSMSDEPLLFCADAERVAEYLTNSFVALRRRILLAETDKYIDRYRRIIGGVIGRRRELECEVRLAALSGAADGNNLINLSCTEAEKQSVYSALLREKAAHPEALRVTDPALGRMTAELLTDENTERLPSALANELLRGLEAEYRRALEESRFFKENVAHNVAERLLRELDEGRRSAGSLLVGRRIPLATTGGGGEGFSAGLSETVILLPPSARSVIASLSGELTPEEYMTELMAGAGEYGGRVAFDRRLPDHRAVIRREVRGFGLYRVKCVNESDERPECYLAYRRALEYLERHATPLWDPRIGEEATHLPLISPKAEDRR